jgi:hypothetical protein
METPAYPPQAPPAPPARKGPPIWLLIGGGVFLCICLGCAGFAGFGAYIGQQEQTAFAAGMAAYQAGNCTETIARLDGLTGEDLVAQAQPAIDHCNTFTQAGADRAAGSFPAAFNGYISTLNQGDTLDSFVASDLDALFTSASPEDLASDTLCADLTPLQTHSDIAAISANAPDLYVACGTYYDDAGLYSDAVRVYDQFLADFPDHAQAGDIEDALAFALVASAKAGGAGNIPAPQQSGTTGGTSVTVIIQNNAPESLRIVFTGPETRIEELDACLECEVYSFVGPAECPDLGPVGTYTLPPGTYEVLVESNSGSETTPFTGTWDFAAGDEYSSCFFIVTN